MSAEDYPLVQLTAAVHEVRRTLEDFIQVIKDYNVDYLAATVAGLAVELARLNNTGPLSQIPAAMDLMKAAGSALRDTPQS